MALVYILLGIFGFSIVTTLWLNEFCHWREHGCYTKTFQKIIGVCFLPIVLLAKTVHSIVCFLNRQDTVDKTVNVCLVASGIIVAPIILVGIFSGGFDIPEKRPATNSHVTEVVNATSNSFESQFSAWDGSHRDLKSRTKNACKDPDSFKHIETRYQKNADGTMTVGMRFSATNSFGGRVSEYVYGTYDSNGRCISVTQE